MYYNKKKEGKDQIGRFITFDWQKLRNNLYVEIYKRGGEVRILKECLCFKYPWREWKSQSRGGMQYKYLAVLRIDSFKVLAMNLKYCKLALFQDFLLTSQGSSLQGGKRWIFDFSSC